MAAVVLAGRGAAMPRRLSTRNGLRFGGVAVAVLVLALGVTATVSAAHQEDAMRHAATRAAPLDIAAEDVYLALSDADATDAQLFLSGAQAGVSEQQRFQADLTQVSSGLAAVNADSDTSPALRAATGQILADLPVYTRLVGVAQADSRQNLPVGSAYLREASALMRSSLLPAAQRALQVETERLASDDSAAVAGLAWDLVLVAAAVTVLAALHVFTARRTRRRVNVGVAVAGVLVLGVGLWIGAAAAAQRPAVATAGQHRQSADTLIATDLAAVRAHGDELLTLAARGEDLGSYEKDFSATSAQLTRLLSEDQGPGIPTVEADDRSWLTEHGAQLPLQLDPQADNSANLESLALVTDPGGGGSGESFSVMDADLRRSVQDEEAGYLAAIAGGRSDLALLPFGCAVLVAGAFAAAAIGVGIRLKEYR